MPSCCTTIIRDMEAILALKKTHHNIRGARVLGMLLVEDGISQQSLADRQGIRLQSVVQTLKHLKADGYVRIERNPRDMREKLVCLTEDGKKRLEAHEPFPDYCSRILQPLSPEEQQTLCELLNKVLEGQPQKTEQRE